MKLLRVLNGLLLLPSIGNSYVVVYVTKIELAIVLVCVKTLVVWTVV